ncbi:hypothetical protein [Neoroseomonas lacus]|nr:hypothetical protein [Neoroseomonas lacus]
MKKLHGRARAPPPSAHVNPAFDAGSARSNPLPNSDTEPSNFAPI